MAYTKTTWVNDQQPDIDADNLNKMEQGIYDAQFPDGGTEGQLLARTANGQGWVDPPNSAVWGGITGDIEDQTDLQAALSSVGKVDSVNGIEPDAQKNVQVDVEITKQGWDALPSSKYTDDINYYIKDGTNIPQVGVISASGVTYSNTSSGLDATTVQGAIDENASEIADVKSGLIWKKLFDADVEQGNTGTLSDSLTNFNEFIVQYFIGAQMKTAICPVSGFYNNMVFGGNEYVSASYKGSTTIRFTSATTLQALELTTTGWTLNKRIRVYAR